MSFLQIREVGRHAGVGCVSGDGELGFLHGIWKARSGGTTCTSPTPQVSNEETDGKRFKVKARAYYEVQGVCPQLRGFSGTPQ
jgi:hypothetical protein